METGDEYFEAGTKDGIDILKIDTEGHEVDVLLGFTKVLVTPNAPRIIQFEYGHTYLPSKHSLSDVYRLLEPSGYVIGRLYPNGVEFSPYQLEKENFRIGNFVAVREGDPLVQELQL